MLSEQVCNTAAEAKADCHIGLYGWHAHMMVNGFYMDLNYMHDKC